MTIPELFQKRLRENPTRTWLFFEDQEIAYKDFDDTVNRLANGLSKLGIKKGERVGIFMRNCPEYLYSWFVLGKIGAIMVPLNYALKGEETNYILGHSEAKAIITTPPYLDIVLGVKEDCKVLENIINVSDEATPDTVLFSKLIEDSPASPPPVKVTEDDISAIIYTSGTTRRPKGVMLSHLSYVSSAEAMQKVSQLTPEDRMMMVLPLFHINAQCYSTLLSLVSGASLIMPERFSASRYWDQVRQYKATQVQLLLGPLAMLLNQPEREDDARHSVRLMTAPITKEMYQEVKRRYNIQRIITGYSQTECPFLILTDPDEEYRDRLIGFPTGTDKVKMEVKIVDEQDQELPPNIPGEMVIKCPAVMKSYYKEPEETARALKNGWLHTGDLCYKDEDGRIYFLDRLKDTVRRAGELIASLEVEGVLRSHPTIEDAAIIPVPDKIVIEEVKAYIVLKPGETLKPEEVVDYCEERLASFKVPRYIEFRESLPKTATERTRKFELKAEGDLTNCWDRKAHYGK